MNGRTLLFSNPFSQYETKLPQNRIQSSLHQESPVATGFHCSHHCNHDNYPSTIPPGENAQKKKWKWMRPWFCSSHTPSSRVQMTDRCPTAHGRTYRLFNFILKKIIESMLYKSTPVRRGAAASRPRPSTEKSSKGRKGQEKENQWCGHWRSISMRIFNFCHFGFTAKRSSYF